MKENEIESDDFDDFDDELEESSDFEQQQLDDVSKVDSRRKLEEYLENRRLRDELDF